MSDEMYVLGVRKRGGKMRWLHGRLTWGGLEAAVALTIEQARMIAATELGDARTILLSVARRDQLLRNLDEDAYGAAVRLSDFAPEVEMDAARAELATLSEQYRWRPVSEEPQCCSSEIEVYGHDAAGELREFCGSWGTLTWAAYCERWGITHWRPLTPGPEGE